VATWLVRSDGSRVRVLPRGLQLGRAANNDLVSADPRASRLHALVHADSEGPRLVPLGRAPVLVNGEAAAGPRRLSAGDRLAIPGLELRVEADAGAVPGRWLLAWDGGQQGLGGASCLVGGGAGDDLVIPWLPPSAFRVHLDESPHAEVLVPLRVGEREAQPGEWVALLPGDRIGQPPLTFLAAAGGDASTVAGPRAGRLLTVSLELFGPGGGRLELGYEGATVILCLPERRADLVAALLSPVPGAPIDDEVLARKVWGQLDAEPRLRINTLAWWTRRDLVAAGCPDGQLIERPRTGGVTRFRVEAGTRVVVRAG
jgi:hypothetical protein